MKIAIIGYSGLVGSEMLQLVESKIKYDDIFLVGRPDKRTDNTIVSIDGKEYNRYSFNKELFDDVDYVLLAVDSLTAKNYCNELKSRHCVMIDNSSAFRKEPDIPLVVPEINFNTISQQDKIIANPNCSTIILLTAIHNIHKKYNIKRLDVSTYQAVSGAGKQGIDELMSQFKYKNHEDISTDVFGTISAFNVFSTDYDLDSELNNNEELKMKNETNKILNDNIEMYTTCVRVPTLRCHVLTVTVTLESYTTLHNFKNVLRDSESVKLVNEFPEPIHCSQKDDVFVGRVRGSKNMFQMVVAGDQIRKGAALNAVKILEKLIY